MPHLRAASPLPVPGEDDQKSIRLNWPNSAPTAIAVSATTVAENSADGTLIGYLTTTDPDPGDVHVYSLTVDGGGRFTVANNQLRVAAGGLLDYETASSHEVTVRTTDSGGLYFERTITITVTDVNEPPGAITLDATSVADKQPAGTLVGALSATDPDAGDSVTFTLVAGAGADDNASFSLEGANLKTATPVDHATKASYSIRVRATDQGGLYSERSFTITVTAPPATPTPSPTPTPTATSTSSPTPTPTATPAPPAPLPGSLTGVVYLDQNGDGQRGPSEPGVAGAAVMLYAAGGDGQLGTADDVRAGDTRTAADGSYSFAGLAPATYQVRLTAPAGYAATTASTASVSVPSGGAVSAHFGVRGSASVAGTAYEDGNGNGASDGRDAGMAGVTVSLQPTTGGITLTTTTGGDGAYALANLTPGTYFVRVAPPSEHLPTTAAVVTVRLSGGSAAAAHFGLKRSGTVSGTVFSDGNGNAVRDAGEPGIEGVTVRLLAPGPDALLGTADDVIVATAVTDADGEYRFTSVPPGAYLVSETDLPGYTSTSPNLVAIALASGGAVGVSFADQPAGSIGGTLFDDLNGNGIRNLGEPGIGGMQVSLVPAANIGAAGQVAAAAATTVTAADGSYAFAGVEPGDYVVQAQAPGGYVGTGTVPVTLAPQGIGRADFANVTAGAVSGSVFTDGDGDGVHGADEQGLADVPVELVGAGPDGILGTDDDEVIATTVTGADGSYRFTDVPPGDYRVRQGAISGYSSTDRAVLPVTMVSGGAASAGFGNLAAGTIVGRVFEDVDEDGAPGAGERGIAGVAVELLTADGASILADAVTAAGGTYLFAGLAPGAYLVRQVDLPGYTGTTESTLAVTIGESGWARADFGKRSPLRPQQPVAAEPVLLPLLMHGHVRGPDLIVEAIIFTGGNVAITIRNVGSAPADSAFWVDLYVDPGRAPAAVNEVWYGPGLGRSGAAWLVPAHLAPIMPGEGRTLTIGDEHVVAAYSAATVAIEAGSAIYAQVDSAAVGSAHGGVPEDHELAGRPYNNVYGPAVAPAAVSVVVSGGVTDQPAVLRDHGQTAPARLPWEPVTHE